MRNKLVFHLHDNSTSFGMHFLHDMHAFIIDMPPGLRRAPAVALAGVWWQQSAEHFPD